MDTIFLFSLVWLDTNTWVILNGSCIGTLVLVLLKPKIIHNLIYYLPHLHSTLPNIQFVFCWIPHHHVICHWKLKSFWCCSLCNVWREFAEIYFKQKSFIQYNVRALQQCFWYIWQVWRGCADKILPNSCLINLVQQYSFMIN